MPTFSPGAKNVRKRSEGHFFLEKVTFYDIFEVLTRKTPIYNCRLWVQALAKFRNNL
jgi:hypothetical protein